MNGDGFTRLVSAAFAPFLREMGYKMTPPSISGRLYRVNFVGPKHMVSVSYEPGDEVSFVMVFGRKNGEYSNIDDRTETPRLSDLNSRYMRAVTNKERAQNEAAFDAVIAADDEERLLLKSAKELRLVLPMYLNNSERGKG
jgi:hypothetical protein